MPISRGPSVMRGGGSIWIEGVIAVLVAGGRDQKGVAVVVVVEVGAGKREVVMVMVEVRVEGGREGLL